MADLLGKLACLQQVADNRWKARCPAHEDHDPSLSVRLDGGTVLVKCYAGCSTLEVMRALGIDYRRLAAEEGSVVMGKQFTNQPSEWDRRFWSKVYAYLLAELDQFGLLPEHREDLLRRGLTEGDILRNGYRSLGPERNEKAAQAVYSAFQGRIWDVPGIIRRPDKRPDLAVSQGLLIPMKDQEGWVRACQVRTNVHGSKYLWFTQGGRHVSQDSVHFARRPHIGDWWAVTEGPLKADVAQALYGREEADDGTTFVSSGGVSSWLAVARAVTDRNIPKPAGVAVAFDQDGKQGTAESKKNFIAHLERNRVDTLVMGWGGEAKGVDDALLAGDSLTYQG